MITPELENYIKQSRVQGVPDAQIRQNLMASGGWSEGDLNEAFGGFQTPIPTPVAAVGIAASSHLPLIFGIIGVLILVGGGFLGYQYYLKYKFSHSIMVFDMPSDEKVNEPSNTTQENPPIEPEESSGFSGLMSGEKDCGTAFIYSKDYDFNKASTDLQNATNIREGNACMGRAFSPCTPAKLKVSFSDPQFGTSYYTIKPEGDFCVLNFSEENTVKSNQAPYKSCKFLNSDIPEVKADLQKVQNSMGIMGADAELATNATFFMFVSTTLYNAESLKQTKSIIGVDFSKMDVSCQ
ncbi:MAG: hypothetical protein WCT29_00135 [Candidatus Paceibacterota bacterium]|jgi:hypothetical protein